MGEVISISISVVALLVSIGTAWLTFLRRGTVKMTQPTLIFFGPDGGFDPGEAPSKVFLRTLLFATSRRGRVIENMHLRITVNETVQNFNVWAYGEERLVRGSGLFVGETGVSVNHHFVEPRDGSAFRFIKGTYRIEVYAKLLGDTKPQMLFSQTLEVKPEEASEMANKELGLYFSWGPDSARYVSHVEGPRKTPMPVDLMKLFAPPAKSGTQEVGLTDTGK